MPKTDKQIQSIKAIAGAKKESMKRRDDRHDYTERRMYMITLEVEERQPVLGRLIGDAYARMDSDSRPHVELSAIGKMVEAEWYGIPRYYPQIKVEALQIMPDHLHGILFVMRQLPVHLGKVISGFKAGCRKRLREMAQEAAERETAEREAIVAAKPQPTEKIAPPTYGLSNEANGLGTAAGANGHRPTTEANGQGAAAGANRHRPTTEANGQGAAAGANGHRPTTEANGQGAAAGANRHRPTTEANGQGATGLFSPQAMASPSQRPASPSRCPHPSPRLFAPGYNDLILRSSKELSAWVNYLWDNPRRLLLKRANPEWLRPFFGLRIGQHSYSGIGNRALLTAPHRLAVRVSRHYTSKEIDTLVCEYLRAATMGAVLVSPAISPGEKRVMRAAFDAGYSTIVLMENGFTPLSKPHGEQFYACANGRLLMLSPFDYHNEKREITSEQCYRLNLMTMEICQ